MEDRTALIQGASIFFASLPLLFFLLPAPVRSRLTAWVVRPEQVQTNQDWGRESNATAGHAFDAKDKTPTKSSKGDEQGLAARPQDSTSLPKPPEAPRIATPASGDSSDARPRPSTRPEVNSPSSTMPPPPRPQQKPSSGTTLAPPSLSGAPSRTSALAQRNNPQARRGPTSSLKPPTTNGSLAPSSKSTSSTLPAPARPRQKVVLSPGHSPLDWAHLTSATPANELAGVSHLQRVTPSMLKQYNGRKGRPAWSAFRGRVYNVSPYMDFHPGGVDQLRRGAGKVGDQLFDEIHSWVNVEGMLGACLVGVLVSENEGSPAVGGQDLDSLD